MPKPQGTYLRIQQNEKSRHNADQAKQELTTARSRDLDEFFKALDRIQDHELNRSYRDISSLIDRLKGGKPQSKPDQDREKVGKVIGEIRKIVENVQDIRQLEGRLSVPLRPVLRASDHAASGSMELALIVAVCQVLEVLVRLRRRK